jgi:hypothetical protein
MRRATAVALVFALCQPTLRAQEARSGEDASIIVFGTVRNVSGIAIAGADVWIDGTNRRVVSNDSGEFRIDQVPSGRVRVMVRRLGFQPDSKRISVKAGDTRQVKFMLDGLLEELDAVIVTARAGASGRMQEFWARRMVGIGVFITRAEIERRHPPATADLFQQVMGVRVIPGSNGESTRLVTGRQSVSASPLNRSAASGACPMQFYVDGIFMTPGTFTVDEITPDMIEAIEVFRGPSEIPARFRQRETGCGLVVIWTREPPKRSTPEHE